MDPTTIKRCQAGKPDAFAALFEAYKNLVYRTAYLLLDNHHEAEDFLQDVFIAVYRSIGSYDAQKGAFSTWLHRITVNRCLNQRRGKNHPAVSIDQLPESFLLYASGSEDDRHDCFSRSIINQLYAVGVRIMKCIRPVLRD